MFRKFILLFFFTSIMVFSFCNFSKQKSVTHTPITTPIAVEQTANPIMGAAQLSAYLPALEGKNVGLIVNHTSTIGSIHLLDTLLLSGINIVKVFAPEHGFRGKADAGEKVKNQVDPATNTPIISLYGKNKKPSDEQLKGIDVLVFDMQDVGARFYTYYSTMFYTMQAAAELGIPLIILERPNPTGHYIDGPILDTATCKSFVGLLPLPIVHALTLGELAQMINGEGWLGKGLKCKTTIIPLKNYTHLTKYSLPVKPSPNLPNDQSIALYPSVCLFEGTKMCIGKGTEFPYQVIVAPDTSFGTFSFTPTNFQGMAKDPIFANQKCYGLDLRTVPVNGFTLSYLIDLYKKEKDKNTFFIPFFEKLIGNTIVRGQIEKGMSEKEIKATWTKELDQYKKMRKNYLLYTDFE